LFPLLVTTRNLPVWSVYICPASIVAAYTIYVLIPWSWSISEYLLRLRWIWTDIFQRCVHSIPAKMKKKIFIAMIHVDLTGLKNAAWR
jgi:hypothetical protein